MGLVIETNESFNPTPIQQIKKVVVTFNMIEKVTLRNESIPIRIAKGAEVLTQIYLRKKPKHEQYSAMIQAASLYICGVASFRCPSHGNSVSREKLKELRLLQWDLAQDLNCSATAIYSWTQKVITSLTPYEVDAIFNPNEIKNLEYNKLLQSDNAEYGQSEIPAILKSYQQSCDI